MEENLRLHMALHNTQDPTCPECGKKFSRIASLKVCEILSKIFVIFFFIDNIMFVSLYQEYRVTTLIQLIEIVNFNLFRTSV